MLLHDPGVGLANHLRPDPAWSLEWIQKPE